MLTSYIGRMAKDDADTVRGYEQRTGSSLLEHLTRALDVAV